MRKMRQLEFCFPVGHGGARKGAGRIRNGERPGVCHKTREPFSRQRVLHVTCRIAAGLPSLRDPKTVALLFNYLARICEKEGFRIVEFSIQGNHIHLLCEADSQEALSRAMNGIQSGMARRLNRHWNRKGKVFADRYHAEAISTPTQCHYTLIYVLANAKKHGSRPLGSGVDPFSTAPWFPFDNPEPPHPLSRDAKPAASPQSWLLREGWSKLGPLTPHDRPRIPKQTVTKKRKSAQPR